MTMLRCVFAKERQGGIMRKQLLGSVAVISLAAGGIASAAPHHAPPPPAPVMDPWTGFYFGGNIGYSWGRSNTTTTFSNATTGALLSSSSNSFSLPGVLGGLQLGYNRLNGNWMWGVEADIQGRANEAAIIRSSFAPWRSVKPATPLPVDLPRCP